MLLHHPTEKIKHNICNLPTPIVLTTPISPRNKDTPILYRCLRFMTVNALKA